MREHVHPLQAQVAAQRLDVVHEPVAAVGRRVLGRRGPACAAQIEEHQLSVGVQSAQVPEVRGGAHGSAGQHDQRLARAAYVAGEPGPVRGGEDRHGVDPHALGVSGTTGFCRRRVDVTRPGPRVPARLRGSSSAPV
ncbi:hypothetical protein HDA41_007779 [Streptomyces caelestis]|uniref:Uncharacterized protein n=1 Tax=Streptomyces caelestis TaxID=36816 RepID=A0A7W9HCP2_9ACTN|nr:hypothetical protein [Streptomyces caelestis]